MKFYSILEGQTQDVLRRLLRLINKNQGAVNTELAKKATKAELKEVTDLIGDEKTAATILYRIKALEDAETPAQEPGTGGEGG